MKECIRRRALELGFAACRFTTADPPPHRAQFQAWLADGCHGTMQYLARSVERRLDPPKVLPGARSIVMLAASYADAPLPSATTPRAAAVARFAQRRDYHDVLGDALARLSETIVQWGGPNTVVRAYVDTGPVLERDLAQRAGLGFMGKHTHLISRTLGNWLLLAEILTTFELEPDPPERNRCGSCTRCLAACPTGAITAPFRLDARRCLSYLTIEHKGPIPHEFRPLLGHRLFGCDDCLEVCPWNRFAQASRWLPLAKRPDLAALDARALVEIDAQTFQRRFADTPLARVKCRGLRRNACVVLGNVGDQSALTVLERAAHDPDALVAEHAQWARARIRQRRETSAG